MCKGSGKSMVRLPAPLLSLGERGNVENLYTDTFARRNSPRQSVAFHCFYWLFHETSAPGTLRASELGVEVPTYKTKPQGALT